MRREFEVEVVVQETHTFRIDANTPEEAEGVAEQWFVEGERSPAGYDILEVVASPAEDREFDGGKGPPPCREHLEALVGKRDS